MNPGFERMRLLIERSDAVAERSFEYGGYRVRLPDELVEDHAWPAELPLHAATALSSLLPDPSRLELLRSLPVPGTPTPTRDVPERPFGSGVLIWDNRACWEFVMGRSLRLPTRADNQREFAVLDALARLLEERYRALGPRPPISYLEAEFTILGLRFRNLVDAVVPKHVSLVNLAAKIMYVGRESLGDTDEECRATARYVFAWMDLTSF